MQNFSLEILDKEHKIEKLFYLIKFNDQKHSAFFNNENIDIESFINLVKHRSDFYIVKYNGVVIAYTYLEHMTNTYKIISWGAINSQYIKGMRRFVTEALKILDKMYSEIGIKYFIGFIDKRNTISQKIAMKNNFTTVCYLKDYADGNDAIMIKHKLRR